MALVTLAEQPMFIAGASVEVGWTVMANHGGGYAYRLAPADGPLTEQVFRKTPLDFVGDSVLRWDGDVHTQLAFDPVAKGWQTSVGTVPTGSMCMFPSCLLPASSWSAFVLTREGI